MGGDEQDKEVENTNMDDPHDGEKRQHEEDAIFDDIIPQRDYRRIGTNVINEKMLIEEINRSGGTPGGRNLTEEFNHAKVLSLENRKILLIQNIDLFRSLEELRLDNNLIEEIENLEGLSSLKILSISNNKIKEIKNLSQLQQLSELNLHNNLIEKIENLENNVNLKILILSKNRIKHMENIMYLRTLRKLKFLNLMDNPICLEENLFTQVGSTLSSLKCFNNVLLTQDSRCKGRGFSSHSPKGYQGGDAPPVEKSPQEKDSNHCDNYEKKISEAYLSNITTLDQALFDKRKEPSVFLKICYYSKIKEDFLLDVRLMNSTLIDQILQLNEKRSQCSRTFESDVESFTSQYMKNNIAAFNQLRKRSKRVVRALLAFLGCEKDPPPVELRKCPDTYKKRTQPSDHKMLNDTITRKAQNVYADFRFKLDSDAELPPKAQTEHGYLQESHTPEEEPHLVEISEPASDNPKEKEPNESNTLLIEGKKYNIIKKYIEKNMEENFLFRDKLINDELANMVSINNFLECFKKEVSKMIKLINDNISDYFRKLEELEEAFNSRIINFFAEVKNNEHPSVRLSEDEINEYYAYKGSRSNILNNLEDFISSSYNKAGTFLIEEKKKHLFVKSRERISEIERIVEVSNDLFYSYLSILRVRVQ
ncbi:leucine-rich repeat protein [Plasmodium knowlesi strain H]|uniref:Leucine-rich repeat protein n=3 Tax=Plasmodium knowlesi TaxID=5850 RepID=A0A5K1V2F7_PLAKH|nr:leucine-rich repeat protein [Plasmodium knowlesi strain H]OTN67314.1 Leucine-rich repeat protein [Plasmodium knowlesi]CAA9987578.1 leucine-rich repeat protein [Plasmodium knowlesi strain H]SBO27028.1 leucine-rich repeat protein [Plasmodium knowlesi strain H]SBO29215.1 leucine-rich repeat protein [Plasmodium knowlesi strain H]VVS77052.1 leucine-rich repeat protein [Plasmodium knowlesi strain H]|eukprot:XP_002258580.1 hypothetical protein, conserved in Plasmodium species [Plasmodium knowlesi strain H]